MADRLESLSDRVKGSQEEELEADEPISRREFGKILEVGSAVGAGALVFSDTAKSATTIDLSFINLDGGGLKNVGTVTGIDAADLSGASCSSGQVLTTDDKDASWQKISTGESSVVTVSSSYTTSGEKGEKNIFADISAGTITVTLASVDGYEGSKIKVLDDKGGAGTNNITIDTEGTETINGESSAVINADYETLTLESDGTDWFIVSRMAG